MFYRFGMYTLCALSVFFSCFAYAEAEPTTADWKWDFPKPQGDQLNSLWGPSGESIFGVGLSGSIVHFDGSTWTLMYSGTSEWLWDVWGTSGQDVFAVGEAGTILHYDGQVWASMSSGTTATLAGVWGASSTDVFAVGAGLILHYDGSSWTAFNTGVFLTDVWGSGDDDVFVVGNQGTIGHYDGNAWSPMISGTAEGLQGVWGRSPTDVYAVGFGGVILHYDGNVWQSLTSGIGPILTGIWGLGDDLYVVGQHPYILHFDGDEWSLEESGTGWSLSGIWGSSPTEVFAVGQFGTILRRNENSWSLVAGGLTYNLRGVWGSRDSDIFAVGDLGKILHYDGTSWSVMAANVSVQLSGVWGTSERDVFAVGAQGTILHYDGSTWSSMDSGTTRYLSEVWGSNGHDVFAVGSDTILHYDGVSWSRMNGGDGNWFNDVWGSTGHDVFAVSFSGSHTGEIWHYDGDAWSPMFSHEWGFWAVWGTGANDIYATGDAGSIFRYDGDTWLPLTIGTNAQLLDIWGSSASDIFVAAGDSIMHSDGTTWSEVPTPSYAMGVWGTGDRNVLAVGAGGTIKHYSPPCVSNEATLCLNSERFEVTALWDSSTESGLAHSHGLTEDTGYFWFFSEPNVEMIVKVIDACAIHEAPRFWFFGGGLTNVGVTTSVRDTRSGQIRTYRNPLGVPFQPIQDTSAFSTCDAAPREPRRVPRDDELLRMAGVTLGSSFLGTETGTTLLFDEGRIVCMATWRTPQENGAGNAVTLTSETGYFWFFRPNNVEILVKVKNACVDPFNRYWIFAAGLTNTGVELTCTDMLTGDIWSATNPLGMAFRPIQDTSAFDTCDAN